ncbi:MAG: acetolactate synthase small subunit [Oscillospiraceae bacterium]|nr:acetolactate synthase small subunit [Oscillospiraceae bacterium]
MTNWLMSLIVNNHFGVLTRVTGLFSRRGYNIASLSVGETNLSGMSRVTIETQAGGAEIHQIIKQLEKLEDVKSVALLPRTETIARELLIIKLIVTAARRDALTDALSVYDVKIPYEEEGRLILEFTGNPAECEALLKLMDGYTVLELCRTGITAMSAVNLK